MLCSNNTAPGNGSVHGRTLRSARSAAPFVLTVLFAGLGHFYLRYWYRGVLWLALYSFALVFLSGYSPGLDYGLFDVFVVNAVSTLEPIDIVFPGTFLVLALVDVYLLRKAA